MTWQLVFTRQAQKDAKKLARAGLKDKAQELLDILRENPFHSPPPFHKLVGDLAGAYSRRITIQHRLVYQVLEKERVVRSSACGHIMNNCFRALGIGHIPSRTRKLSPATPKLRRGRLRGKIGRRRN